MGLLTAAADWRATPGGPDVTLAANVSPPRPREPGSADTVRRAVEDHGIETNGQADYLAAPEGDPAQGFLHSCAVEAVQVPKLLRSAPLPARGLMTA